MSIAYDGGEWKTPPQNVPSTNSDMHPAILAYQRAKKTIQELQTFIRWEDELFSNPNISGNHKLQIRATKRAVQRGQTKDEAGRTRINLTTIAEQIGVSPDTMSRGLKFLKESGVIPDHEMKPEIQENGERWTRHYISLDEDLLAKPKEIAPPAPRNHGGVRYTCQKCGSEDVKIRKRTTIICKCCQHESLIEETEHDQLSTGPQDAAQENSPDTGKNFDMQDRNLRTIIKPVSPPMSGIAMTSPTGPQDAAQDKNVDEEDLQAAAALLLAIAGEGEEHIEMSRTSGSKYFTVQRALTLKDMLDHLKGKKARGAWCRYDDGQTRALAWDTDNETDWQILEDAARALVGAGYLPILEPSPADRGGHLWIIFDGLVSAVAAKRHAISIAPQLAEIEEYWPGPQDARKWNKVRLPGGKYVRPEVNAWCRLKSVADGDYSNDNQWTARLLLSHQTPVGIVPVLQVEETAAAAMDNEVHEEWEAPEEYQTAQPAGETVVSATIDVQWQQKYGHGDGQRLWFSFTPAYVAEWFNDKTAPQDLLPPDRRGFGKAEWRGERTGSVAFRGDQWTDFGAGARRTDGTQDSGDALELKTRLDQTPKPDVMRQAAKDLVKEARAALECAARSGDAIPAWLEEIITPAGREHYERIRNGGQVRPADQTQTQTEQSQNPDQAEQNQQGGLTGFSIPIEKASTDHHDVCEVQRQLKNSGVAVPSDFLEEHGLSMGQSCTKCGCEIERDLGGEAVCVRCYPPKGYHTYSEKVDGYFPRRYRL